MLRRFLFSVFRFNPPFMTGHRDAETQSNFQVPGHEITARVGKYWEKSVTTL